MVVNLLNSNQILQRRLCLAQGVFNRIFQRKMLRGLLQQYIKMPDDLRNAEVVFHHFLMMATTLIRRSCRNDKTHLNVYFNILSGNLIRLKQLSLLYKKLTILKILLSCPKRYIERIFFIFSYLSTASTLPNVVSPFQRIIIITTRTRRLFP